MYPYQTHHDYERTGMTPDAHSLNATAFGWNAAFFNSNVPDTQYPATEDASFPQLPLEPAQPSPPFTRQNFPIYQTLLNTQAVGQNNFLLLPAPPVVPGYLPLDNTVPGDNFGESWNDSRDGGTRAQPCYTEDEHSSVAVPTIDPPISSSSSTLTFPSNWIEIPQRSYKPGSKQWNFKRLEPIHFDSKNHPGINLGHALRKNFVGLRGQDEPVLQGVSGSISCRLLLPGYPPNGDPCHFSTQDWRKVRKPIRRSKLAHEVAKKLDRYLTQMARTIPDGNLDACWRVGHGFMRIDNMFLVSLKSVSKGSFQPEIWVAAVSPAHGDGH